MLAVQTFRTVSEAIKTQTTDMAAHLEAYKSSLRALASRGIEVVFNCFERSGYSNSRESD